VAAMPIASQTKELKKNYIVCNIIKGRGVEIWISEEKFVAITWERRRRKKK
jgi:hypothetical protein